MPIARVQLEDGRIARFEVPEGTSPREIESAALEFSRSKPAPKEPENTRSTSEQLIRQAGLTARYGIEGALAIPTLAANAVAGSYNALADAVSPPTLSGLVTGEKKGYRFPDQGRVVSDLLTKIGLPQPDGATERVVGDVTRSMAGTGGVLKAGEKLAQSTGPVVSRVGKILASNPGAQLTAAGTSGGAAGATRESGGGEGAQIAAGLAAGVLTPAAVDAAVTGTKAVGSIVRSAVKPMTNAGREEIVGTTLSRLSTDPKRAIQNIDAADEIVAGSVPTAAQAARDPGLLTAERAVRSGPAGTRFTERASQNNAARNLLLNSMAGDDAALAAARGERLGRSSPLYEQSFAEVVKPPQDLVALANRPAFTEAMKRAQTIASEQGIDLGNPLNTMRGLHYVKMAMDDIIENAGRDTSVGRTQRSAIIETQKKLLGIMDELSPTYASARESFKSQSGPINQMEALQDVRSRVLNAGTDAATGERLLSPAKFYQAFTKNEAELSKILTPDQMRNMRSIAADLERAALSDSAGKAAGSNTYQNISTAYALWQAFGGSAPTSSLGQNLMRPLAWLNKLNEPALQQLLTDALLDPKMAKTLMSRATPQRMESLGLELAQRARAYGVGATSGVPQSARQDTPAKATQ